MNATAHPVVDGVTTLAGAPDGYHVDFANPQQQYKLAHYLIVSLACPLALVTLGQRLYTKLYLSTGLKLDDGQSPLASPLIGRASSLLTRGTKS